MIVGVPTIKGSGPNVKSCGLINMYMDFGYGLIKIKVSESSPPVKITHDFDLEKKFAGNPLLKDNSKG